MTTLMDVTRFTCASPTNSSVLLMPRLNYQVLLNAGTIGIVNTWSSINGAQKCKLLFFLSCQKVHFTVTLSCIQQDVRVIILYHVYKLSGQFYSIMYVTSCQGDSRTKTLCLLPSSMMGDRDAYVCMVISVKAFTDCQPSSYSH